VEILARGSGLGKTEIETVLEGLIYVVSDALVQGKRVSLFNFGIFAVQKRTARTGRMFTTGESLHIPERKVPVFRASQRLKDAVNAGPQEDE